MAKTSIAHDDPLAGNAQRQQAARAKAAAHTALAEEALQACKRYGHGYRFATIEAARIATDALIQQVEDIAARLAATETK